MRAVKEYSLGLIIIIGVLSIININCSHIPHKMASMASSSYPGCLYFVETNKKLIALTIDDGPDPNTTHEILDVLKGMPDE